MAAISEAGGLGILASAIYQSREEFAAAIDRIHELTDKPFAVNINLFPAMRPIDNNEYMDVLVEKGVKIVETSGHSAPESIHAPIAAITSADRAGRSSGIRSEASSLFSRRNSSLSVLFPGATTAPESPPFSISGLLSSRSEPSCCSGP